MTDTPEETPAVPARLRRPGHPYNLHTTPRAVEVGKLLGGTRYGPVTATTDEMRHLRRLYGYVKEKGQGPNDPALRLLQAGADRNLFRHAEVDGLRIVAWFAKYLEPGEDPLRWLIQRLAEVGAYDLDPNDVEWANGEEPEEDDK